MGEQVQTILTVRVPRSSMAFSEAMVTHVIDGISRLTSVDFHQYKRSFVQRQIRRQVVKHRLNVVEEYEKLLLSGKWTAEALINGMTVNVTQFFRDPPLFELLMKDIFPLLWRRHQDRKEREFRIWVMGCSTGEEAYSVAIALHERARSGFSEYHAEKVRIFATDLDEVVVQQARRGEYKFADLSHLDTDLVERYFVPGEKYRVIPELRRQITFGQHDLLKAPFIHHLDMIFCRNVLIFMDRKAQEGIYGKVYDALDPEGVLVLGRAESPTRNHCNKGFVSLCRQNRVFQKVSAHGADENGAYKRSIE